MMAMLMFTRSMLQRRKAEKQRKTMAQRLGNCPCSSSPGSASSSSSFFIESSSSTPLPSTCSASACSGLSPSLRDGGVSGWTSAPRSARLRTLTRTPLFARSPGPVLWDGEPPSTKQRCDGGPPLRHWAERESGSRRSMAPVLALPCARTWLLACVLDRLGADAS